MGEQSILKSAEQPAGQSEHNDASDKLRLSLTTSDLIGSTAGGVKSNSQQTVEAMAQYQAGRYALVTAEGLSLLPSGIVNGVEHNWDHPGEFAVKMGTAALMGVGMRALLPEAGAARALVGTAMTYFMAKDAVMPVVDAWKQVSDTDNMNNLHDAATKMSNGLGLFTVDLAAGLPIGLAADKLTGLSLKSSESGRAFESWKENALNSNNNPVGRFFNWSQETADAAAGKFAETSNRMADRLLGEGKPGVTMEDKLRLIKDGGGFDSAGSKPLTIDEKLKLITENIDHDHVAAKNLSPDAEAAFKAYLEHKRWHKAEMPEQIDALLGKNGDKAQGVSEVQAAKPEQQAAKPESAVLGAESKFRAMKSEGESSPEPVPPKAGADSNSPKAGNDSAPPKAGDDATPPKAGDDTSPVKKSSDATDKPTPPPARPLDKNAETVGQMSTTMRDLANKVGDADKKIANFRESVQSPLTQTMRTGKPPLDEGHFGNNKALVELAGQIETPEHVKQAGFLLEHHRVANIQMGIPDQMPEIVDLNQYSRSVHKNLMDLLRKEGIDPGDVLRGTNSPVFLIFDSNGSGPYTIPAIKGVTDTAVIVLPREYQQMLGVHVAGVYPHELGHDLIYGDLLRFPDNLRDRVLRQDVVSSAMEKEGIADTDVEMPGVGTLKKSDLFTKLLLAEANENTADIFGTAIDPNTPLSLATLLGSLRKPAVGAAAGARGQLETRSMYGTEFANEGNPLGIEPHGIDAWRIKLGAEVLRQLSNNNPKVTEYAKTLDSLSDQLRRPGDNYVWASMDNEGKFVSIPIKEWDAIIPGIVKAQLETPLPALNNKMLRDVYPDMNKIFPRVDGLAEQFATSARGGDATVQGFDKSAHGIEDVYSAGLSGWMKAIAQNPEPGQPGYVAPEELLARIDGISKQLTALYRGDNYLPPPPVTAPAKPINFASLVTKPLGFLGRSVGSMAEAEPSVRQMFSTWAPKAGIYAGVSVTRGMFDSERRMQELFDKQTKGN